METSEHWFIVDVAGEDHAGIWDIPPEKLCKNHLFGEHRELHAVWAVITDGRKGYATHPETARWRGKLRATYLRHEALAAEMGRRGYAHKSPLDKRMAAGVSRQDTFVDLFAKQIQILRQKGCNCAV